MTWLERLVETPEGRARLKRWGLIALGVVVLAEVVTLLAGAGHPHFWFERIPAWGSLYGLVSCVAIIVGSKLLGKAWLMRPEDHHDD